MFTERHLKQTHTQVRLREQSMASSVVRLERRIFKTWRRNHVQFKATRKMSKIHRIFITRQAFKEFRVKTEICRRKIFMHIRSQRRVREAELRWKTFSWVRRINAKRYEKIHLEAARIIQQAWHRYWKRRCRFFEIEMRRILQNRAAMSIQKRQRGRICRNMLRRQHRECASVSIQRVWRGYVVRRRVRNKRLYFNMFWSDLVASQMKSGNKYDSDMLLRTFPCKSPGRVLGMTDLPTLRTPRILKSNVLSKNIFHAVKKSERRRKKFKLPPIERFDHTIGLDDTRTCSGSSSKNHSEKRRRVASPSHRPQAVELPSPASFDKELAKSFVKLRRRVIRKRAKWGGNLRNRKLYRKRAHALGKLLRSLDV